MVKRVSIKGKGADIFFGDYSPDPSIAPRTEDTLDTEVPQLSSETNLPSDGPAQLELKPRQNRPKKRALPIASHEETQQTSSAGEQLESSEPQAEQAPPKASPDTEDLHGSKHAMQPTSKAISTIASAHASMIASNNKDVIELIRKTVKLPGKEVSFVRLTPAEKGELADVVYEIKRQGRRTSETEINRIAVNFILQDYKTNGENSILARVIAALLA